MKNRKIQCVKCQSGSFKIFKEYNPDTTDQYMHVDYKCLECGSIFPGKTTSHFYIECKKELSNI